MYYIGVDVGGTNLVAGLVDENGVILDKVSRPLDKTMNDRELCAELADLSLTICTVCGKQPGEIKAVGVGIPGLVDNDRGEVVKTTNMAFGHTPFRELFQQKWHIPVYLGNDANCAAIGEYCAGAAKGCDPAVIVTLGTGVGGGLVCNGKLFTGFAGSAMEVGHMIVHPQGVHCPCGNDGCWEQYGSASAIIRLTREEMRRNPDSLLWKLCEGDEANAEGRTAFDAASRGDESAEKVLEEYRKGLSLGLINLVNIIQPQVICLGGGVSNAPDALLLEPLRELVLAGTYDKNNPTKLVKASLGNDAGVVGAAMLCRMV